MKFPSRVDSVSPEYSPENDKEIDLGSGDEDSGEIVLDKVSKLEHLEMK